MVKAEKNLKIHILDARGKILGRLASEIARILIGKHKTSYLPHRNQGEKVEIVNAAQIHFTGKKLGQKVYYHHSGYPGGLKVRRLQDLMAKDPAWALRHAVLGMLPKNKLQKERIKRLIIKN